MHVAREAQVAGQRILGVVMALDQVDRSAGFAKALSLSDEEQPGSRIGPRAIPEVACNQDEGYRFEDARSIRLSNACLLAARI